MNTSRILCICLLACSTGCSGMPKDASSSSYLSRLQAEKNRYYISLRDGALSRVLAIQPESVAWQQLKVVARQWEAVDAFGKADALVAHLEAKGLAVLCIRLRQALRSTVNKRPRPLNAALEADALKQALLEAFRRLEKEG